MGIAETGCILSPALQAVTLGIVQTHAGRGWMHKMCRIKGERFTELIYILGKMRRSVKEKPLLGAGARADREAKFTEND